MENDIGVIGGGLAGPMLARILHVNGIAATIYEAEAAPRARTQGYLLDIHEENGQRALRDADLFDAFMALARPGEDAKRVVDSDGAVMFDKPGSASSARPEVDRGELRNMLLDALPQGTVKWNCKVKSVATDGRRHTITFADGTMVTAGLIIGADGAWSKVRSLLSDIKPAYTGTCFIEVALLDGAARHQASIDAIGSGTLMAVAPGKGIMVHRYPDGTARGYVGKGFSKTGEMSHTENAAACEKTCQNTDWCAADSFFKSDRTCMMLRTTDGFFPNSDAESSIKRQKIY